jgi:phenylacetic acid degradation operon negative regulatory protein
MQVRNRSEAPTPGRPLTARSVMASALLGMDPPELPVAQLVRLTGLFGISENRARVALSRMVAAGEATSDGSGRYRLAGHLAARQTRQSASRSGATTNYDGSWWLAVVTTTGSTAEVRSARRRSLGYARLSELREGVWMRPANVAVLLPDSLDVDVEVMSAVPPHADQLAARLWDLPLWARHANELLHALAALDPGGPEALAPGFELSAAVLRHLQADPLLPDRLQPSEWPGTLLRSTYDSWDARYRATLNAWSRAG